MLRARSTRFHPHLDLLPPKFRAHVDAPEEFGCWFWTGPVGPDGYGIAPGNSTVNRWSYRLHVSKVIPVNKRVVNTCGNQLCVNPQHLRLVRL